MSSSKTPRRGSALPQHEFETTPGSESEATDALASALAVARGEAPEDDQVEDEDLDSELEPTDEDPDAEEDPSDEDVDDMTPQELVRRTHAAQRPDYTPQRRRPVQEEDDEDQDRKAPPRASRDNVRRSRREEPEVEADPTMVAAAITRKLLNGEADAKAERLRRAQAPRDKYGRRLPEDTKRRRPTRAFARRRKPDQSIPVNAKGERVEFPGKVLRWVRETDHEGRPVQTRVNDHLEYGWECPVDPYTKKPYRSGLGVLMVGSPLAAAERSIDYMPQGALNRDDLLEDADEAMEEVNRKADDEVCRLVVERSHRMHRAAGDIDDDF